MIRPERPLETRQSPPVQRLCFWISALRFTERGQVVERHRNVRMFGCEQFLFDG
jgi:hypothetical protein